MYGIRRINGNKINNLSRVERNSLSILDISPENDHDRHDATHQAQDVGQLVSEKEILINRTTKKEIER